MQDGVRLAASTWLPPKNKDKSEKYTGIVTMTRYWRAMAFVHDDPEFQSYYRFACYLLAHGYVLVAVDTRGSGASFGYRETEASPLEVEDLGEIIEWVASQKWCDGQVAAEGTSYTANTGLYSLVTSPPGLKLGVCRAPDFDIHRYLFAPGGIANHWFIEKWGKTTYAQDTNDVAALFAGLCPPPSSGSDNVLGVRPVDQDENGSLLKSAISEHKPNYNVAGKSENFVFVDNKPLGNHRFLFEQVYKKPIECANVPVVIRCGWHDAGVALGALAMFASFSNPIRVILGPWSHGGYSQANPFVEDDGTKPCAIPPETVFGLIVKSLDAIFKDNKAFDDAEEQFGLVEYYTFGENRWKTTRQWPLPQTKLQRLYLAADNQLCTSAPASEKGSDLYRVDPTTGTGFNNRWHTQMGNPIFFVDRREEDKKLLIYDTPPLEVNTEITGHPIVHLFFRSSTTDGQFFVYLETVDPDGRVRLLTEGQLRALHRKVSDEPPPYKMFGPYHSLKEKDALLLKPGMLEEITFDLFPISVLLRKGQRIRLAIAGADSDVFALIPGCEDQTLTVERNNVHASYIDLPIIP